ncbi:ceramidase domain-containing protein [Oceanibium sediminis]|uniref:ceramidase domain-containing protein n=1 Tax=Oceanibium sediminis TaxID=2026339 RepID=UPI000DD34DD8|nr:ceramidase domain-containing protein [Oceanibium sediminis]
MDWMTQVDNYCERTDFSFWSEPLNAATNAAFILSALIVWAMLGGKSDRPARLLTGILLIIGIGSFLFHTYATRWALALDVFPIQLFILAYLFFATTRFFALPLWAGLAAVIAFFPFAYAVSAGVSALVGPLNGSVAYVPVPILIFGYAAAMAFRDTETARGLAIGAGILVVSLVFRTMDEGVCGAVPFGTHFLWHVLNGVMLGWMIIVLHHHRAPEDRIAGA